MIGVPVLIMLIWWFLQVAFSVQMMSEERQLILKEL